MAISLAGNKRDADDIRYRVKTIGVWNYYVHEFIGYPNKHRLIPTMVGRHIRLSFTPWRGSTSVRWEVYTDANGLRLG